jgi:hypothetical protein
LDHVQRKIAAARISFANVLLVHVWQELMRVTAQNGAGLTTKEKLYLRKRVDTMQEITQDVHRVWERCQHGRELPKVKARR